MRPVIDKEACLVALFGARAHPPRTASAFGKPLLTAPLFVFLVCMTLPAFLCGATAVLSPDGAAATGVTDWTANGTGQVLENNASVANDGDATCFFTAGTGDNLYASVSDYTVPSGQAISAVRVYVVARTLGNERIDIGIRNGGVDDATGSNSSDGIGNVNIGGAYAEYWEEWTIPPGMDALWNINSLEIWVRHRNIGGASTNRVTAARIEVIYSAPTVTTAIANGNWKAAGTWDNGVPGITHKAVIGPGFTVIEKTWVARCYQLEVNGGVLNVNSAKDFIIGEGGVQLNGGTLTIKGNGEIYCQGGAVTATAGATLNIGDGTDQARLVCGTQDITCAGTLTIDSTSASALGCGVLSCAGIVVQTDGPVTCTSFSFTGSTWSMADDIAARGAFSLGDAPTDTLTQTAGTLTVTGAAAVSGAYTKNGGIAIFNGALAIAASGNYMNNAGATSCNEGASISGTLTVKNASALAVAAAKNLTVNGTINLNDTASISLGDGGGVTLNNGALFTLRGTNAAGHAYLSGTTPGASRWSVTIGNGAALDARYATFDTGTIILGVSPAQLIITDSAFINVPNNAGDACFFDVSALTGARVSLQRLTFTLGAPVARATARNIRGGNSSMPIVMVTGYDGDLSGEAFDKDPNNRVRWTNNWTPLQKDDGATSAAPSLEDALSTLGSSTLTIRGNYDSGSDHLVAANEISGTLTLPDFSGTLNLDGLTFTTAGAPCLLDASGVTGGGVIHLYNCVLADPEHAGTPRQLINLGAGNATINATFCTIDSDAATAGLSSTASCLFTFPVVSGWYVSYPTRNLRLSKAGAAVTSTDAPIPAYPRDADGKMRAALSTCGAFEFQALASMYTVLTDVTGGAALANGSTPSAVHVFAPPAVSSADNVYYVVSTDGTYCYLSAVNKSSMTVIYNRSWSGYSATYPMFIQTSDATNKYWLYVPYDKDGDGLFDTIRKFLHTSGAGIADTGDIGDASGNLSNAAATNADITNASGWSGMLFLLTSAVTGASETQFAFTTQIGGGQVHLFYINRNSTSGGFFADVSYTMANRAAETYESGGFPLAPAQSAAVTVTGSTAGGTVEVTRVASGASFPESAAYVRINRVPTGKAIDTMDIVNAFTGPALGSSFSTEPVIAPLAGGRRYAAYDAQSKAAMVNPVLMTGVEADAALPGYAGVAGLGPTGHNLPGVTFLPMYNAATGMGAIAAVEYKPELNGDTTYEVLGGSYSDTRIRYHGAAPQGSFSQGVAQCVGKPTALLYAIASKTLMCGTDAGLLYSWTVSGSLATEDASAKGALRAGYPIGVAGGRITRIAFQNVTDAAILSALNMAGSGLTCAVYTSSGEVTLLRIS